MLAITSLQFIKKWSIKMQKIHTINSFGLRALPSIAVITFSCIGTQAWAIGTEDKIYHKPLQSEFNTLDINRDGKLTQVETAGDADFKGKFALADKNHDGLLMNNEYSAFKSRVQQSRIEAYLDDSTVTAKIKAELFKDTGTKGLDISVETHKGQVILSGFVDTHLQSRRAMQIASGIRGVHAVKNGLVIKS